MRETDRLPRRVHGRAAIRRALFRLQLRAVRFGMWRATEPEDRRWAARIADGLAALAAKDVNSLARYKAEER